MNNRDRAAVYARQRGVHSLGRVGWGYNATPKQAKRLQKKYIREMKQMLRGLRGLK